MMVKSLDLKRRKKWPAQIAVLFLIMLGFTYFFLSKNFLESKDDLLFTPLYETTTFENRDITIISWLYSPTDKRMEVMLQIEDHLYTNNNDYEFTAASRKGGLETDVQSHFNNFYIVFIEGVSRDFKEISFRVKINDNVTKFYTNYYQVKQVETIHLKSNADYKKLYLDNITVSYNEQIVANQSEIQMHQDNIVGYEKQISEYQQSKKYQTAKEIIETNSAIEAIKNLIENEKKSIKILEEEITEYNQKITLAEKELHDLENATQ